MVKLVTLENIQAGMVLAAPLKNKFGQVLLAQGAAIESKHIFILKTWGIQSIMVNDEQTEDRELNQDPGQLEEAKKELMGRMKWTPRNPIEEDMFKAGVRVLLQNRNIK